MARLGGVKLFASGVDLLPLPTHIIAIAHPHHCRWRRGFLSGVLTTTLDAYLVLLH